MFQMAKRRDERGWKGGYGISEKVVCGKSGSVELVGQRLDAPEDFSVHAASTVLRAVVAARPL